MGGRGDLWPFPGWIKRTATRCTSLPNKRGDIISYHIHAREVGGTAEARDKDTEEGGQELGKKVEVAVPSAVKGSNVP